MRKKIEHYLLTVDLRTAGRPTRLHAYVMTTDATVAERVGGKLMDYAEEHYGQMVLPIILCTRLQSAAKSVRKELCKRNEAVRETLTKATDFHCTMWEMMISDPWDKPLMALH